MYGTDAEFLFSQTIVKEMGFIDPRILGQFSSVRPFSPESGLMIRLNSGIFRIFKLSQ